jgi:hypothetical protein
MGCTPYLDSRHLRRARFNSWGVFLDWINLCVTSLNLLNSGYHAAGLFL